jgi:hypothetical protein
LNRFRIGGWAFAPGHSAVEIRHLPGFAGWFCGASGDEVEMQVVCPFAEGDGIHPITIGEVLH